MRWCRHLPVAGGALLLAALVACVTNPATGRRQLILMSSQQELALGRQADPEIRAEYGVYDDASLGDWLAATGRRVAAVSERPGLPYSFTLLDSPVVNAFALPGGPVYATRGLLAHARDEAEIAGVLGHEVGHVVGRHGAEQMSRAQLTGLGLGAVAIARPKLARAAELLGVGANLLLLKFGRDAEREADALGLRYLVAAGYDPYGLPRYLAVLQRLAAGQRDVLPPWLSTHPDPGERVAVTRNAAAEAATRLVAAGGTPIRNESAFFERIDGMVFGDDPRQGFLRGTLFHHPTLRFRIEFPEGWEVQNTARFVVATDDRAQPHGQVLLTLVPEDEEGASSPDTRVAALARSDPTLRFEREARSVNGLPAWSGRVVTLDAAGRPAGIVRAAWIAHGGRLYRLLGRWNAAAARLEPAITRAIGSFRPETDPQVLGVRPAVLRGERARAGDTLARLCARRRDLGASCEAIGQLNRVGLEQPLEAGYRLEIPVRQHPLYPPS